MFSQLKSVVDLIRSGIIDFRKFKSDEERKKIILDTLKIYFLLLDCVDEGEKLIKDAGADPIGRIRTMESDTAIKVLTDWDAILRKQGIRLYALQGHIFGQDHLAVINPKLKDKLTQVIGYKMDRAVTLHGIGATLFLRNMFPIENTNEEKARLVGLMTGARGKGVLNLKKIKNEISALRQSLEGYRLIVGRLVTTEQLLSLSGKARKETIIEG